MRTVQLAWPSRRITRVGMQSHNDATTGTDVTVDKPPDVIAGRAVIVWIHCNNTTTIDDNNGATPFTADCINYQPNPANGQTFRVFHRIIEPGDPDVYSFTLGDSGRWRIIAGTIINPNLSQFYDVEPTLGLDSGDLGVTTIDAISIDTLTDNAINMVMAGWDGAASEIDSVPPGYATLYSSGSNVGSQSLAVAYKRILTPGSTGNQPFTGTDDAAAALSLAVRSVNA